MIPNKLYIPTSTLNFNNIMASESISPAIFYSTRNFGYKRFEKVISNNLDTRILLYSAIPDFEVDNSELENYPLIIELTIDDFYKEIIHSFNEKVFYAEETIYLTPFTCKIIFRNEAERISTLSKVDQSLNTKMVPLYQNVISAGNARIPSSEWVDMRVTDSTKDFSKYISKDRKINKLKGFLFTYILGANRSVNLDVVILKKYSRELQNLISAIITNPSGVASPKQEKELNELYEKFNDIFTMIEGASSALAKRIEQKKELYKCPNFIDILKEECLYDVWLKNQKIRSSNSISPFKLPYSINMLERRMEKDNNKQLDQNKEYFTKYFTDLESIIDKLTKREKVEINDLPILENSHRIKRIPVDDKGFQSKLFNEYSEECWSGEEFLLSRIEFATAGGKLFKEELQNNWDESPTKEYINNLRKNIASHTPFSINSIQNLTLQSFAVFCQKGEDSVDKLEDYLIINEINDYRIAFGLWGVVFGFANTPKTLTNDLFLSKDEDYVSEIYKYVFKQIHNVKLEGKLRLLNYSKNTAPTKINEDQELTKLLPKIYTESHKRNSLSVKEMGLEIETIYREKLKLAQVSDKIISRIIEILKSKNFIEDENTYKDFSTIPNVGKKTLAKIRECLQNPRKIKKDEQLHSTQTSFLQSITADSQTDEKLLLNKASLTHGQNPIEELDCFKSANEETIKRLKDNWSYVIGKETTKDGIIKYFINLCKKEGEGRSGKHTALHGFFTESIASLCKEELERKYE